MASYEIPTLFDQLLDVVIQVTNADKGFIVLLGVGRAVVKVARKPAHKPSRTRQPSVRPHPGPSDGDQTSPSSSRTRFNDTDFKDSLSVMNLRLASVMCVPFARTGQSDRNHLRGQRQRGPAF